MDLLTQLQILFVTWFVYAVLWSWMLDVRDAAHRSANASESTSKSLERLLSQGLSEKEWEAVKPLIMKKR